MITKHTIGLNIPPQQNHEKIDIKEPIRTHASQSASDDKTLQKSNLGLMEKIDLQKESMSGGQVWVTV